MELQRFTIVLPVDKHRKFKAIAAEKGVSMTKMVTFYIDDVIREWEEAKEKHGSLK